MIMQRFSAARRGLIWAMLLLVVGVWLAAMPLPAHAQSAPEGRGSDPAWQASYWTNPTLAGDPILTRDEPGIAYNWGSGSPAPQVPADRFSARWSRYLYFDRESVYRFALASDDGVAPFHRRPDGDRRLVRSHLQDLHRRQAAGGGASPGAGGILRQCGRGARRFLLAGHRGPAAAYARAAHRHPDQRAAGAASTSTIATCWARRCSCAPTRPSTSTGGAARPSRAGSTATSSPRAGRRR
jgi:hypothetical protein